MGSRRFSETESVARSGCEAETWPTWRRRKVARCVSVLSGREGIRASPAVGAVWRERRERRMDLLWGVSWMGFAGGVTYPAEGGPWITAKSVVRSDGLSVKARIGGV